MKLSPSILGSISSTLAHGFFAQTGRELFFGTLIGQTRNSFWQKFAPI